jgi:tRNA threonylcarbamoyladenosine biosynthesis protein TsaE
MTSFAIDSARAMREAASRLGALVDAGDAIALIGDLGAGKTEFVKGLAAGLGVPGDPVTSPTFTIVQSYHGGRVPLHHVDLYRLEDPEELRHIGLDDLYRDDAVVAVEWFDRFPAAAPREYLAIAIEITSDQGRRLTARPEGERAARLLAEWEAAC